MRYGTKRCGLRVEGLERRDVPGAVPAFNPGDPQADRSGNLVGELSAAITGNGALISVLEATQGLRNEQVWIYLAESGRGPL